MSSGLLTLVGLHAWRYHYRSLLSPLLLLMFHGSRFRRAY